MRFILSSFEYILVGSLGLLTISFSLDDNLIHQQLNALQIVMGLSLAWLLGYLISYASKQIIGPIARQLLEQSVRFIELQNIEPSFFSKQQYSRFITANEFDFNAIENYLELKALSKSFSLRYHHYYGLLNLNRSLLLESFLLTLLGFYLAIPMLVIIAFVCFLVLAFSYYQCLHQILSVCLLAIDGGNIEFKTTPKPQLSSSQTHQFTSLNKSQANPYKRRLSDKQSKNPASGQLEIMIFSGGTGFREINMALARRTQNINRAVPVWDNGGSSKALRESFGLMPVGDIRHALMTQAHGEGRVGLVVKLFNWRLSSSGDTGILKQELNSFVNNQHPLIQSIEHSLGNVIITYLKQFADARPDAMELRSGSIGNFVLVGAYLAHNKDINTAIYVFRQLCSIQGNVWPVSLENDLHLNAKLEDKAIILGQENTTKLDRSQVNSKIKSILFNTNASDCPIEQSAPMIAQANPMVLEALKRSELIVYGPGSFFTSILPHLMVDDIASTIVSRQVPKVFIGNLLDDNESYGYSLEDLLDIFVETANQQTNKPYQVKDYISHVLVNRSHAINKHTINNRHYLRPGGTIDRFKEMGVQLIIDDFESPWKRGQHDADWIAEYLMGFEQNRTTNV